jgi:alpha-L-rhamnosidase
LQLISVLTLDAAASYLIPGYQSAGFDDSGWDFAQVASGPAGVLVNARNPPTVLVESLRPLSITQPVPGIYVAAFERVVAGWTRITATGPAKTLITIHVGELLNEDGTVVYQGEPRVTGRTAWTEAQM